MTPCACAGEAAAPSAAPPSSGGARAGRLAGTSSPLPLPSRGRCPMEGARGRQGGREAKWRRGARCERGSLPLPLGTHSSAPGPCNAPFRKLALAGALLVLWGVFGGRAVVGCGGGVLANEAGAFGEWRSA